MGERLENYISFIEDRLNEPVTGEELERLKADLLTQISFFQHERLVHLIVTVTFALLSVLVFLAALVAGVFALWGLLVLFLALLIPYILHYYKLENGVQRLYRSYDRING